MKIIEFSPFIVHKDARGFVNRLINLSLCCLRVSTEITRSIGNSSRCEPVLPFGLSSFGLHARFQKKTKKANILGKQEKYGSGVIADKYR